MPKVKSGESRNDFVARCVPIVKGEGLDQDAAVGKCEGIFDSARKSVNKSNFAPNAEIKKSVNIALGFVARKIQGLESEVKKQKFSAELPTAKQMNVTVEKAARVTSQYVQCRKDGLEKEDAFRKAFKSAVLVEKSVKIGTVHILPDGSRQVKTKTGWESVE